MPKATMDSSCCVLMLHATICIQQSCSYAGRVANLGVVAAQLAVNSFCSAVATLVTQQL